MAKDPRRNGEETEREIAHRVLDTVDNSPAVEVVATVADLQSRDPDELTPIWGCIDGILDHLFSKPPDQEAQAEISFNYEGYRITVNQEGGAKFVDI